MAGAAPTRDRREPAMLYRRVETKLGVNPLRSDRDLARAVSGLVTTVTVEALSQSDQ